MRSKFVWKVSFFKYLINMSSFPQECYTRIIPSPAQHSFVMQGTDRLFLSSISVFNIGSYRQQTIVTGTLPADTMTAYIEAVEKNPSALFTLTTEKALLSTILSDKSCKVTIYQGLEYVCSILIPLLLI